MKRGSSKPKPTSTLDPILPLPAGTGIPLLREGEGADILNNPGHTREITLSYRAFWIMWEQAEALASKRYPQHVGGSFDGHAQAVLEAATEFRRAFWRDHVIEPISEDAAIKIRAKESKPSRKNGKTAEEHDWESESLQAKGCPECGSTKLKAFVSKKTGKNRLKCRSCNHKWTPKPSKTPSTGSPAPPEKVSPSSGKMKTGKARDNAGKPSRRRAART